MFINIRECCYVSASVSNFPKQHTLMLFTVFHCFLTIFHSIPICFTAFHKFQMFYLIFHSFSGFYFYHFHSLHSCSNFFFLQLFTSFHRSDRFHSFPIIVFFPVFTLFPCFSMLVNDLTVCSPFVFIIVVFYRFNPLMAGNLKV